MAKKNSGKKYILIAAAAVIAALIAIGKNNMYKIFMLHHLFRFWIFLCLYFFQIF